MPDLKPVRAPNGLGAPGKALWKAYTGTYQLDPQELVALTEAARASDELAVLESELKSEIDAGRVQVTGSMGQPTPNRLFSEVRSHRLLIAQLLKSIQLPSADGSSAKDASAAGRALVSMRYK